MKELYTSPEMKLLCFASAEKLASGGSVDFDEIPDDALSGGGGASPEASEVGGDINVDIDDLSL